MRQIDILVTGALHGGNDIFSHGDLRVVFHRWLGDAPLPLLDGQPWAFVGCCPICPGWSCAGGCAATRRPRRRM
jgi:hypothetical protein